MSIRAEIVRKCMVCEFVLSGINGIGCEDRQPEEGDLSVCHRCLHVSVFTADGLRELTDADRVDPEYAEAIAEAEWAAAQITKRRAIDAI